MLGLDDTIAGIATPPGVGGVAVVRVSGRRARQVSASLVAPWPRPRQAALRTLRDPDGRPLDEALVLWMPGPRSFTGEDTVEHLAHPTDRIDLGAHQSFSAPSLLGDQAGLLEDGHVLLHRREAHRVALCECGDAPAVAGGDGQDVPSGPVRQSMEDAVDLGL